MQCGVVKQGMNNDNMGGSQNDTGSSIRDWGVGCPGDKANTLEVSNLSRHIRHILAGTDHKARLVKGLVVTLGGGWRRIVEQVHTLQHVQSSIQVLVSDPFPFFGTRRERDPLVH